VLFDKRITLYIFVFHYSIDENPFISDSDESLSGLSNKSKEKCFTITFSVEDWKIIQPRSLETLEYMKKVVSERMNF